MKIKADNITNLTDARYFAAKEVEWLTFNFTEGSHAYIEPMKARAMFEWVAVPNIVGAFERVTAEEAHFYAQSWGLKAIQVGSMTLNEAILKIENVEIIKEFDIEIFTNPQFLRQEMTLLKDKVSVFQFNFQQNGITWEDLQQPTSMLILQDLENLCKDFNIILKIDFQPFMLKDILSINPFGLVLEGGEEERVGVKSYDELDEIFDELEIEA
jgi:phosphoribosylanthranilate isomerase